MKFCELLEMYCKEGGCSNQQLAEKALVSKSLIGRYKKGERTPSTDGQSLKNLAKALEGFCLEKGKEHEENEIYENLRASIESEKGTKLEQSRIFSTNMDYIMGLFGISNAELSRFIHVDASLISRIRREKRKVPELGAISEKFATFISEKYFEANHETLENLLGYSYEELNSDFCSIFVPWLSENKDMTLSSVSGFLDKLDAFDLNEYIKAIKFNEIKVPTIPVAVPTIKNYYGIQGIREGTIDFLKSTALSNKKDDFYLYNDLPMETLAEDIEFSKKWMLGLAAILKKGLRINVIHCLDRPFNELMLGLESWIPLYMTGQISPYYLQSKHNDLFCRAQLSSGACVLTGECLADGIEQGMYGLSKKQGDIEYGQKRGEALLKHARPLMNIYRKENEGQFLVYIEHLEVNSHNRKEILSCPPLYSMSHELIDEILEKNGVNPGDASVLKERIKAYKRNTFNALEKGEITSTLGIISKEDFAQKEHMLNVSILSLDYDLKYDYDTYSRHIEMTKALAEANENYHLEIREDCHLDNIQIFIYNDRKVCLSKNNTPIINYIIEYPKLVKAFNDMVIPIIE